MENTDSTILNYKKASILFLNLAWKVFAAISVIVTVGSAVSNFEYLKIHPLRTCIAITTLTVLISLLLLIRKLINEGLKGKPTLVLSSELVNIVNTLYEEEKYLDVVRFGSTVSRYLWLNGHNHERIAIGKQVEDAAGKECRVTEQVSALIDDIGWTYYIVGDSKKAITNISNGVEKALEEHLFYLAAKGERHLSGISKHDGKIDDFKKHLTNAETYTAKIIDTTDKNEMEASLHLARAKYAFETDQLEEAEKSVKLAIDIFKNDLDRIVKVHQLLGNIYVKQNRIQKAKDEFNKGYESCKDLRKDEFAKNAIGLAKIALSEGDIKSYTKYLNEARLVYVSHRKGKEVNEIDVMLKKINT